MEFAGKVMKVTDSQFVGNNNLEKKTILVKETKSDEDYKNNSLAIDFLGDKVALIDGVEEGDTVKVMLNFKAREATNGNIYNGITGWKVDKTSSGEEKGEDLPF